MGPPPCFHSFPPGSQCCFWWRQQGRAPTSHCNCASWILLPDGSAPAPNCNERRAKRHWDRDRPTDRFARPDHRWPCCVPLQKNIRSPFLPAQRSDAARAATSAAPPEWLAKEPFPPGLPNGSQCAWRHWSWGAPAPTSVCVAPFWTFQKEKTAGSCAAERQVEGNQVQAFPSAPPMTLEEAWGADCGRAVSKQPALRARSMGRGLVCCAHSKSQTN